jgi:hypothetical protein
LEILNAAMMMMSWQRMRHASLAGAPTTPRWAASNLPAIPARSTFH